MALFNLHQKILVILTLFVTFNCSYANANNFPKQLKLTYEFKLAELPLGLVEKNVSSTKGKYTASSKIKPNPAAKLFFTGQISETSEFIINSDGLLPLKFKATRIGSKPYDRLIKFDHKKRQMIYKDGHIEPLLDNTYDIGSFPFALMLEDHDKIKNKVFYINGGKSVRAYVANETEKVVIDTPAGNYSTTKITLKRKNKNNRFYYVWLDQKSGIPVKIVRTKNGKVSTLILSKVK